MVQAAAAGFPTGFLHLPGLDLALRVGVSIGFVVMVAAFGRPIRVHLGIEGPVRNIEPLYGISERHPLELIGRKPAAPVPAANRVAHLGFADLHREQTFWPEGILDLLVRHQRRRTAEVAPLPNSLRIED